MAEKLPKPDALRIVAAVILGIFVGFILFFVFALFIGAFNQAMGMNIPVIHTGGRKYTQRRAAYCDYYHLYSIFLLEGMDYSANHSANYS